MSRPAPRRHRAARLLALTSGPTPTAEEPVDVRPKPELFSLLLLTQRERGVRYSHVYFSRFYEPGARLAFARPTTPSKPVRPHGNAAVRDQRARMIIARRPSPYSGSVALRHLLPGAQPRCRVRQNATHPATRAWCGRVTRPPHPVILVNGERCYPCSMSTVVASPRAPGCPSIACSPRSR